MECSICLEEVIYNENFSITPCKHIFCFNCITISLKNNKNCPCCRRELIKLDDEYDDLPDLININDYSEYYITENRYYNNFYRFNIRNNNIINIYESYNNQYSANLSTYIINNSDHKLYIEEYFKENINILNEQLMMFNEDKIKIDR